ncbi:MAG TPA: FAD-dependent oxidoreductase, partial [Thermodesulfobacteriaceae bacterium]|nr:FAD-dependent oxidoreductase [Thermodesulfobacteriaceae bacterium]
MEMWINETKVKIKAGQTILEVAKEAGIQIPTLCFLPGAKEPPVPCGLCVVEVEGRGLVRACSTLAEPDMKVFTETEEVKKVRKQKLESLVVNHYGDCKAPCEQSCPGGLNIQGYISLIARGEYASALSLIKERLPLPATVGRVCPRFCEPRCRRAVVDMPVAINDLKRFVADWGLAHGELKPEIKPSTGKRVAVVGAGPAGLSAAYYLRLNGHEVTIFEAREEPGGMPRWAIPEFKLPKDVLRKEIESILSLGIELKTGKAWGRDFNLKDLFEEGFEAVFLAIGSPKERFHDIPGEKEAVSGLEILYKLNSGERPEVGKRVLVMGGGYTAVDVARSLLRLGAEVTLLYPRSRMEMPAPQREIREAEKEGVKLFLMALPLKIEKVGHTYKVLIARTVLSKPDQNKARKIVPLEGSEETHEFDLVVRAWGKEPYSEFKNFGELEAQLATTPGGQIKVSSGTQATNLEGVWAGGDFASGPKTVIQAVAAGRRAAENIHRYLMGLEKKGSTVSAKFDFNRGRRPEEIDLDFYRDFPTIPRETPSERPVAERVGQFEEVVLGFTEEQARREAERCLKCG